MTSRAITLDLRSILTECSKRYVKWLYIAVFEFFLAIIASEIIANDPVQSIFWPI